MPEYKASLKFESTAIVYIEAADEAAATVALEAISETDLRQATLWENLFVDLANRSVLAIEDGAIADAKDVK